MTAWGSAPEPQFRAALSREMAQVLKRGQDIEGSRLILSDTSTGVRYNLAITDGVLTPAVVSTATPEPLTTDGVPEGATNLYFTNARALAATSAAYQPVDAQLTALAGLAWASGSQVPVFTGAATVGFVTIGSGAGNILDKAAGDALYQPKDADLTTLGGLAKDDSNFIVGDGSTWVVESGATARTSLGLGDIATLSLSSTFAWTAAHTFTLTTAGTAPVSVVSTDSGAAAGPWLVLDRQSASPAAADTIGSLRYVGRDSAGNSTVYGAINGIIDDPTDGSEDSNLRFFTMVAGTSAIRLILGAGLYYNGGSDMGANTINSTAYYASSVKVVGSRVTGWAAASGTKSKATFDSGTVTTAQLAQRVGQLIDDLISHGLIGA